MPAAARKGDEHKCPLITGAAHEGGTISTGAPTVNIEGQPAARQSDLAPCKPSIPNQVLIGEPSVRICGQPAARKGDTTVHGGLITTGASTVNIGSPYGWGAGAAQSFCMQKAAESGAIGVAVGPGGGSLAAEPAPDSADARPGEKPPQQSSNPHPAAADDENQELENTDILPTDENRANPVIDESNSGVLHLDTGSEAPEVEGVDSQPVVTPEIKVKHERYLELGYNLSQGVGVHGTIGGSISVRYEISGEKVTLQRIDVAEIAHPMTDRYAGSIEYTNSEGELVTQPMETMDRLSRDTNQIGIGNRGDAEIAITPGSPIVVNVVVHRGGHPVPTISRTEIDLD